MIDRGRQRPALRGLRPRLGSVEKRGTAATVDVRELRLALPLVELDP